MPLKVTAGQSRKLTHNYNSQGFNLNIEAELPANAIDDTETLASTANHLFQLVHDLLEEQVRNHSPEATTEQTPDNGGRRSYRSRPRGNGDGNGHRGITAAQSKAIQNMAKRLGYDPETVTHEEFGTPLAKLTIKQASDTIDILKKEIESQEPEAVSR